MDAFSVDHTILFKMITKVNTGNMIIELKTEELRFGNAKIY